MMLFTFYKCIIYFTIIFIAPREKKSKKPVSPGKKSVKGRKAASEDLSENDSGDSDLDDDSGGGAVNSLTVTPVRSTSRRTSKLRKFRRSMNSYNYSFENSLLHFCYLNFFLRFYF